MVNCSAVSRPVVIHHLYVSPGHNFFGHHGQAAGEHPMLESPGVTCRAGRGIEGDRFFGYRPDYKGQITFFAWERYLAAKERFARPNLSPAAFRRNVLIDGIELNTLIGAKFSIGEVEFLATEECRPCYWMDGAVAPGADPWLRGQGGLRARILSDGVLRVGPQTLTVLAEPAPGAGAAAFAGKSLV